MQSLCLTTLEVLSYQFYQVCLQHLSHLFYMKSIEQSPSHLFSQPASVINRNWYACHQAVLHINPSVIKKICSVGSLPFTWLLSLFLPKKCWLKHYACTIKKFITILKKKNKFLNLPPSSAPSSSSSSSSSLSLASTIWSSSSSSSSSPGSKSSSSSSSSS